MIETTLILSNEFSTLSVFLLLALMFSQTLIAQNETTEGLDKVFHTSDEEGETATQPNRRKGQKTQILPEGAYRVGCVCMTGEVRSTTGIGSCAGHGGVRYWLVVNKDGETLQYPTARHALNADNEPAPYIGPNPQQRYTTQPPTIIVMPAQPNGLTNLPQGVPQYPRHLDSQIIVYQALPVPFDSTKQQSLHKTALYGLPLIFDSLMQLCMILVVCGTLVIILKMFMQQGDKEPLNSLKVFKNIRLTLIEIFFNNNRFK